MTVATVLERQAAGKRCTICNEQKPLAAFNKHCGRKDGYDSKCKKCNSRRGREWYHRKQNMTKGLYSTYVAMKQRCYNAKHDHFSTYGGRGIRVCDEWRDHFGAFYGWATQNGYQPGLQLDRIDNDKGYSPDNCRFVTPSENARNKRERKTPLRNNPTLTVDQVGQIRELLAEGVPQREIGRRFGVTHGTIWAIKAGRTWTEINRIPTNLQEN